MRLTATDMLTREILSTTPRFSWRKCIKCGSYIQREIVWNRRDHDYTIGCIQCFPTKESFAEYLLS
jgi:hypothetical protein